MVTPSVARVVLVRFPFSDLSDAKLRPAIVIADAGRGDWILCQVTSNPYGDPKAIALSDDSFVVGSLRLRSFARPGKLFTASQALMVKEIASLDPNSFQQIVQAIVEMVKGNSNAGE